MGIRINRQALIGSIVAAALGAGLGVYMGRTHTGAAVVGAVCGAGRIALDAHGAPLVCQEDMGWKPGHGPATLRAAG